jgi:hypothetical protein
MRSYDMSRSSKDPNPKHYRIQVLSPKRILKLSEVVAAFEAVCHPQVARVRAVTVAICADDGTLGAKVTLASMSQVHRFTRELLTLGYVVSANAIRGEQEFAVVYATRRHPERSMNPRVEKPSADLVLTVNSDGVGSSLGAPECCPTADSPAAPAQLSPT